jgi:hypothetical protein
MIYLILVDFFIHMFLWLLNLKKESLKSGNEENKFSKFGTYLRYKRISNYENKTRMHLRMLYF